MGSPSHPSSGNDSSHDRRPAVEAGAAPAGGSLPTTPLPSRNYLSSFATSNRLALGPYLAPRRVVESDEREPTTTTAMTTMTAATTTDSIVGLGLNAILPADENDDEDDSRSGYTSIQRYRALTRSRSAMPIRAVRDQMEDLRGRISSLQRKAREDHLKRRSLQSLRTPSPSTAAERWYLGADVGVGDERLALIRHVPRPESTVIELSSDGAGSYRGEDGPPSPREPPEDQEGGRGEKLGSRPGLVDDHNGAHGMDEPTKPDHDDPKPTRSKAVEIPEEGEKGANSVVVVDDDRETEYAATMGERHEDRADAFDYEHFFLHSGMGHYSSRHFGQRDSFASDVSIDTARPVDTNPDDDGGGGGGSDGSDDHRHRHLDEDDDVVSRRQREGYSDSNNGV